MTTDAKPVRPGEELDEARLRAFLRENLGEPTGDLRVEQFPAGSSNLTYLVSVGGGGEQFVLRRPPFGNRVRAAHDMSREFQVLSGLSKIYPPAPRPLLYCADESVIGSEFYLMERRSGLILRGGEIPQVLKESPRLQTLVCESFIENLADLHALDYEKAGLGSLGKPEGYVRRQVEGWVKRYAEAKTDEHPELERTIEWLSAEIPAPDAASGAAALIHNDYKFDNVMLNPDDLTETVAVLDWEMATVGEPLMDLGTTLGYWMSREAGEQMLSMPFNPRVLMENVSRRRLCELYAEKSGRDTSRMLFYYVFGTFKIAVIAQQIYFRFSRGFTRDRRFARFNVFVDALGKIALFAIGRGEI